MSLTSVALVLTLAFASGCTITTYSRGHANTPEPEPQQQASNSEGSSKRPHRPARPRVNHGEPKGQTATAKPDPVVSRPKPSDVDTKPKPDPKPPVVAKPEPKPPVVAKPEPKPPVVAKPEPKPPVVAKPKPKPPVVAKPEPKPPVTRPQPEPVEKGLNGFVVGVPEGIKAGSENAYYVYLDEKGWHLRTTTAGSIWRTFKGKVSITEGKFASGSRVTKQTVDGFVLTNRSIQFDFKTSVGIDGIDFTLLDARCVKFELAYEGKLDPKVIKIGAKKVVPPEATFTLCKP